MNGSLRHVRGISGPARTWSRAGRQGRLAAAALAAPVIALAVPVAARPAAVTPAAVTPAAPPPAAAAVRATAAPADAAAGHVPAPPPGWTTEFADNFNGPGAQQALGG